MNLRVLVAGLVLGFVGLLLVMGAFAFVRWLRERYPQHFRLVLAIIVLTGFALAIWMVAELRERPAFHVGDVLTLGEPLAVRALPTQRLAATTTCIVEIHEHLAIVEIGSGTLKTRVESNKGTGPNFCPSGALVQFDPAWLQRFTLTHRHS